MNMPTSEQASLEIDFNIEKKHFQLKAQALIKWDKPGIHVIFGKSGCGKSHLLRAIAGLEKAQGTISFQGETWLNNQQGTHKPCHERNVSMVFQEGQLFSHLNVNDNLLFAFKRSNANQQDWQHCILALNLQPLLNKSVSQLSGGEKQRVALGRSLLSKPALLLMDEPLASLDWASKQEIMPYIQHICQEWSLPILYVTHSLDEVMQLADNVIMLEKKDNQSHIEKMGPLLELLQDVQHGFNQSAQAGSIINGTLIETKNEIHNLDQIQLKQHILFTNKNSGIKKGPIRLRIQASDVSLCLSQPDDSSILNILPVLVLDISPQNNGQSLVQLDLDGQYLLSRISTHSVERLNLHTGLSVFAQIKAVALQRPL